MELRRAAIQRYVVPQIGTDECRGLTNRIAGEHSAGTTTLRIIHVALVPELPAVLFADPWATPMLTPIMIRPCDFIGSRNFFQLGNSCSF